MFLGKSYFFKFPRKIIYNSYRERKSGNRFGAYFGNKFTDLISRVQCGTANQYKKINHLFEDLFISPQFQVAFNLPFIHFVVDCLFPFFYL